MSKRQLHVIGGAYRATLEEQDDTVVWLCHSLRGAGAELDFVLSGNAVGYGLRGQEVRPLSFGRRTQKQAPNLARDLAGLLAKRVTGYYVEEDAAERGIEAHELLDGLVPVPRAKLATLFGGYDQVHRW
jgi:hypothetical protein